MEKFVINKKAYRFQDMPVTKNKDVLEFLFYIQELYNVCRNLLRSLINENKKVITTIGFVGSIIDRISESLMSIFLLSSKGFTKDSAIILVNLIELRTDLKYISKKPNKIKEWFNHEKKWTKPWKFSMQIKEITNNEKERELERFIYELCSMAKHGNPVGHDISFNIGLKDGGLFINENKDYRMTDYLFWTYVYTSDSIKSCLAIIDKYRIKLPNVIEDLEKVSKKIKTLYFKRIMHKKVMDYVYEELPELKKLDEEVERLEKKKEKLKAKMDEIETQIRK